MHPPAELDSLGHRSLFWKLLKLYCCAGRASSQIRLCAPTQPRHSFPFLPLAAPVVKTFVSPDNDWFRKFLFEDDHELYRTLVALVRTERFFPDSEQVIAYGLACAAVIFLL